ncbi:hypothetical protein [Deinococcus radiotolerans]|uniref:C2H2-type domain-containing protein n=1 Tax=Deinococcus radiotolerans TaxID=1309407 RepID=A0ABQ2FR24_9DEIO|nr:hypothetical protein [Deinococcus radiotolerans]GGL18533.1 hypothetical protein GCM10010844_41720 [Deinococcus radiotolerans]
MTRTRMKSTPTPTHLHCPVRGCGAVVRRAGESTEHLEPHQIQITASRAAHPFPCPCARAALLEAHRSAVGEWSLAKVRPSQEDREQHNLIAHALITGQAFTDGGRSSPAVRTADPNSAGMVEAFMTGHNLAVQACVQISLGRMADAQRLAERALAANAAYQGHARAVKRARRADAQVGRWHNAERFWIRLPVTVPVPPGQPPAPPVLRRFQFEFLAVWGTALTLPGRTDRPGAGESSVQVGSRNLTVLNGPDIERDSGIPVGVDGWRQLIDLLTRFDDPAKSGKAPDPLELVWHRDGEGLSLRRHIKAHYPRAVHALEALRRTLSPVPEKRKGPAGDDPHWEAKTPQWVYDAISDPIEREDDRVDDLVMQLAEAMYPVKAVPVGFSDEDL